MKFKFSSEFSQQSKELRGKSNKVWLPVCLLLSPMLLLITPFVFGEETAFFSSDNPLVNTKPTLYGGFSQLLDDEETIPVEELQDIDEKVTKLTLYHTGDRLHRDIPKPINRMIANKLMGKFLELGQRFEMIECVECRTTKVNLMKDQLSIRQSVESNQQMRQLAQRIRTDAFVLWNASHHENKFTINVRVIRAKNSEVLWLNEYSKITTKEEEVEGFDSIDYEIIIGSWGIGGSRQNTGTGSDATFSGLTSFGVRRRETTTNNEDVQYTLGVEYFQNFGNTEQFNLAGVNLEGRILAHIPALDDYAVTFGYLGVGQGFLNGSSSLVIKMGLEFPFVKNGFMDFGMIYMSGPKVKWDDLTGFENSSSVSGASYDLTLGYRF